MAQAWGLLPVGELPAEQMSVIRSDSWMQVFELDDRYMSEEPHERSLLRSRSRAGAIEAREG
jgi:hypothetical protein